MRAAAEVADIAAEVAEDTAASTRFTSNFNFL